MAKIGFIGTGIMGKPMAINLQKAGHQIFLSQHHDQAPAELTEAGAIGLRVLGLPCAPEAGCP